MGEDTASKQQFTFQFPSCPRTGSSTNAFTCAILAPVIQSTGWDRVGGASASRSEEALR